MRRVLVLTFLLGSFADSGYAAPRSRGIKKVPTSQITSVSVTIKNGKKTVTETLQCLNGTPGRSSKEKAGMAQFQSIATQIKNARARSASASSMKRLRALLAAGKLACKTPENYPTATPTPGGNNPGTPTPFPTPVPTPLPDFLDIAPYTGAFTREEAHILFERFAFGANPQEIDRAVAEGLQATVNRLLTWVDDPGLEAYLADYGCDGRVAGDPQNRACDPTNPNDFYSPAIRYELYTRPIRALSQRFPVKLYTWLHDERGAAVTRDLNTCTLHALKEHHHLLMTTARGGDFINFIRGYNSDLLGHVIALNGRSNTKYGVNQDYPREVFELFTIGTHDLDGNPMYTDADIAEVSRAYTGWKVEEYRIGTNNVCLGAFVKDLHDQGPKTIWPGTPYESVVFDAEDVLRATFSRSDNAVAMNLAKEMWQHFVNPYYDKPAIERLAAVIRDNRYNLYPAFKQLMLSKAVYAQQSRKALIKQPIDMVLGFQIQTGIPMEYDDIDDVLEHMGQQPLNPPTVFGTYEDKLAGESYVLEWRNSIYSIIFQNDDDLEADYGFIWHFAHLNYLNGSTAASVQIIDQISKRLNVPLNAGQFGKIDEFLNFDQEQCYQGMTCPHNPEGGYYMSREVWDPDPRADDRHLYKYKGALAAVAQNVLYRLK